MRLLLDTHALLWWAHEPENLSSTAMNLLEDAANEVLVSAVSAMEIATKNRIGRLEYQTSLATHFSQRISEFGFTMLSISGAHAQHAGGLKGKHKDPWDRLLAAQAQLENIPLLSVDKRIADWNVELVW